ncbi:MAG: DedA family protein [Candidatus Saccharimonadales bacterium]
MVDFENLLGSISVIGALAIIGALIFAESAFLFGLFVPGGDTLLVISGVLAAEGILPLWAVMLVIFLAAVTGDNVGYTIGQKTGPRVFHRKEGFFFRKEYADRAAAFYHRHGGETVVIARFIAYVRTIAPLLAGIGNMPRGKFAFYNLFGALFWTLSLVLLGYWLGKEFADLIERYIVPATLGGLLLLFAPTIVLFVRNLLGRR